MSFCTGGGTLQHTSDHFHLVVAGENRQNRRWRIVEPLTLIAETIMDFRRDVFDGL